MLAARLQQPQPPSPSPSSSAPAAQQQNAALGLLTDKFRAKYALSAETSASGGILTPRSNPGYYQALMRDLEDVPNRTWAQRLGQRLKGMVRFS